MGESAVAGMLETMSGPQKAAVLLVQLGKDRAATLLRCLREDEIEVVMTEIALLQHVEPGVVDGVMEEFKQLATAKMYVSHGGATYARDLLEASVGQSRAHEILERLNTILVELPFEFMRRADPRQVLSYLQDEHPQTIALVLAHMPSEQAATVLSGLPEELQGNIAARIAMMDRTDPEVIRHVEAVLQRKLSSFIQQGELTAVGGIQPLVDILNYSDRTTEKVILEGLERDNPELAETVRGQMFVFEDIVNLDDRSIQLLLREVDNKELAVALKGVRDDVRQKIMKNMSERAAANLADEIDVLGPMRAKTVGEAQGNVVRVIRNLEESGQVVLSRGSGADDLIL